MVDVEKSVQIESATHAEANSEEISRGDFGVSYNSWSVQLKGGSKTVHFWTHPFAITVVSIPHRGGSLLDWWVSAAQGEMGIAELVFRSSYLVPATGLEEIEETVREFWEGSFHQVATSSSRTGGFTVAAPMSIDYTREKKLEIVRRHMTSHDEMWQRTGAKRTKVASTASHHRLITSFGLKQTQAVIAEHEYWAEFFSQVKEGEVLEEIEKPSTAHINQRLQQAKKMGLLTPEASSPSEVSAELKRKTNEKGRSRI